MDSIQVYSKCAPLIDAGLTAEIKVGQTLSNANGSLLGLTGPDKITIRVDGPQTMLTPADIVGVYPAPGSEESPDEFLPHIALNRRTLPWERSGPNGVRPWMALLLFKESELKTAAEGKNSASATLEATTLKGIETKDLIGYQQMKPNLGLPDSTPLNVIYVPNALLPSLRPDLADLPYVAHMKRTVIDNVTTDVAIVISNRLPDAGPEGTPPELHTAVLVSLEDRADLYSPVRNLPANLGKKAALIVLHHWTFKPSKGGDFEQVMRSIAIRPNGGVLRYGNLAKPAGAHPLSGGFEGVLDSHGFAVVPQPHTQPGNLVWRGPLRPFKPAPRTKNFAIRAAPEEFENAAAGEPLDYSHASAFEIGRLLALSNLSVLDDLRNIRVTIDPIEDIVATDVMPPALKKHEWVINNLDWFEQPWSFEQNGSIKSIVKSENEFLGKGQVDIGGIAEQVAEWGEVVLEHLGTLGTPVSAPVVQVNFDNVTVESLNKQFADVQIAGL